VVSTRNNLYHLGADLKHRQHCRLPSHKCNSASEQLAALPTERQQLVHQTVHAKEQKNRQIRDRKQHNSTRHKCSTQMQKLQQHPANNTCIDNQHMQNVLQMLHVLVVEDLW